MLTTIGGRCGGGGHADKTRWSALCIRARLIRRLKTRNSASFQMSKKSTNSKSLAQISTILVGTVSCIVRSLPIGDDPLRIDLANRIVVFLTAVVHLV